MRQEIEKLLSSNLTNYQIAKDTQMSHKTISELRAGKRKVGNLTLDTAEKLFYYQKGLEEMEEVKSKIIYVENPHNIADYEGVQRFYIDIINFGDTYDVEYADIAEVEHDTGIYFIVELNTVREIKFADAIVEDVDLENFFARFEREDEKGETVTETLFFHSLEDAEEYIKIVLEGDESFEDCAKRIGFIE